MNLIYKDSYSTDLTVAILRCVIYHHSVRLSQSKFVHNFTLGMSFLISRRRIFPLAVFGIDSTNRTPPRSFLIGDTLSENEIEGFAIDEHFIDRHICRRFYPKK